MAVSRFASSSIYFIGLHHLLKSKLFFVVPRRRIKKSVTVLTPIPNLSDRKPSARLLVLDLLFFLKYSKKSGIYERTPMMIWKSVEQDCAHTLRIREADFGTIFTLQCWRQHCNTSICYYNSTHNWSLFISSRHLSWLWLQETFDRSYTPRAHSSLLTIAVDAIRSPRFNLYCTFWIP